VKQILAFLFATCLAAPATAQQPAPATRTSLIEQAQGEKAAALQPYRPGAAEKYLDYAENYLLTGKLTWHPFFQSAYSGGGFTLGAGYLRRVGSYNQLDMRGSITFSGYKRIEAQFLAPALFRRQATLSLLGGWREATQVGFYGLGSESPVEGRTNYGFQQPYGAATLEVRPARSVLVLGGGLEVSEWKQTAGSGTSPSIETVYTPATLPGLGASPTYLHSQGTVGIDWRTSPGYSRRGGFYGVTIHDFADPDSQFGFTQTDYEVVQHLPLLREAWVLSFHGRVETTSLKNDQQIPFFMLPANGGGSDLRGFSSWRFRDRHSLLLQAEWRIIANRYLDMAVFYDTGKVTTNRGDLNLDGLKDDFGLGFRMHGPMATPLRIEFAKSKEGLVIVFGSSAVF
jgi:Omp85 superfamily domain